MPFVITAGTIIFESFMNICYTLSHVRLTQGFVILLLTIQIIRRATCSNNTGSTISVFLNKAKGTSPLYVTGPSLFERAAKAPRMRRECAANAPRSQRPEGLLVEYKASYCSQFRVYEY